jgi:cell division protein FtsQ
MQDEGNIFTEQPLYNRHPQRSGIKRLPKQTPPSSKIVRKVSLALLLISSIVLGWLKLSHPETFPIYDIKVKGYYPHIDRNTLRQTILPFVQKGFIMLDTAGLQDRLLQIPWVATANIQRVWPDKIIITLTEQQPMARFGKNMLLTPEGNLFAIEGNSLPQGLPLFIGPQDERKLMIETYPAMKKVLSSINQTITILAIDSQQFWRLQLNNGIVLLIGKIDALPRLQRFADVYSQVVGTKSSSTIDYIDLRYNHGMAVHFKNQNPTNVA